MFKKTSLFVYGSFVEGRIHHEKLKKFIQGAEKAFAKGSAYRLPVGYPVLCAEGDDWVPGQLVEMEGPEILFRLLDEFHGVNLQTPEKSLFFRAPVEVRKESSETFRADAYVMNPLKITSQARKIDGGDWQKDLEARPSLLQQLTEKQKDYIHRLGSSTGREIVPIDLNLYRELMKLDLIVDKGRRLALTKLGKDIYRFLDWKWEQVLELQ